MECDLYELLLGRSNPNKSSHFDIVNARWHGATASNVRMFVGKCAPVHPLPPQTHSNLFLLNVNMIGDVIIMFISITIYKHSCGYECGLGDL